MTLATWMAPPWQHLSWIALTVVPLCAFAYSSQDITADHTAAAISFAEEGNMELAVLSFRAAAKFAPAVPEHWYNLGTALRDEDYAGASQDSIVREARNALRLPWVRIRRGV